MTTRKPYDGTRLTALIEKRIVELRPTKTQAEIAAEAGFTNVNMLSMIKTGATRLPIDRVPALAAALDVDAARLFQLPTGVKSNSMLSPAPTCTVYLAIAIVREPLQLVWYP